MNRNSIKPILAMVFACTIWGVSGAYYNLLSHIPPVEVLAHRSFWSMIFFSIVLLHQKRLFELIESLVTRRELLLLSGSSIMIASNWFAFIFAIQSGQAIQASFGYYVFPLVAVSLGYFFKGERFSKIQIFAIIFASLSVIALGFALRLVPSIALIIALTFGAYGLIKSFSGLGSIQSVTIETMLIAPVSLGYISYNFLLKFDGNFDIRIDFLLLTLSGLITGGPLILFSYATKKLSYATVGILQYINPTLQFLVAIIVLLEPFNLLHAIALCSLWIGIIIYSVDSWRLEWRR